MNQSKITVSPSMVPTTLSYVKQQSFGMKTDEDPVIIPTTAPITQTDITFSSTSVKPIILQVETYSLDPVPSTTASAYFYFQQLKVPGNCYVDWASVFIEYLGIVPGGYLENWTMAIYNSTISPNNGAVIPDAEIAATRTSFNGTDEKKPYPVDFFGHWENVTLPHQILNCSKTSFTNGYYNFFVGLRLPRITNGIPIWYYCPDNQGISGDYGRAYACLANFSGPGTVHLYPLELPGIDFTLIVKLSPAGILSKPSDIGLRVNGNPVLTTGNGTGTISILGTYAPVNGQIAYNITSTWSDQTPGTLQFVANFNYITATNFIPAVTATVNTTAIIWNVAYTIQGSGLAGKSLTIESTLPVSWNHWQLYNVTRIPWVPVSTFSVTRAPTGKSMMLVAMGLSIDKFLLVATAPIIQLDLNFTMAGHHLDVYQDLVGQIAVVHGPNGEIMILRGDNEGGIKDVATIVGIQNAGSLENLVKLDGAIIRFTNDSKGPFIHPSVGPFTFRNYINTSFDLFVTPPEGFRATNVRDIELVLDYASFNQSWWIANFTGATMPDNPNHWNLDGFSLKDWYKMINYDGNISHINFTIDSKTRQRYSDFYFNMSATVYNETLLPLNFIKAMNFMLVMNFNYSDDDVQLFIKNQTLGKFVQLNSTTKRLGYDDETVVLWNSDRETGFSNITQFIKNDGKNTIQVMIRPKNETYNINRLVKTHNFYANVMLLNFTYTNTMKNFTMQAFNQTSGKKLPAVLLPPGVGTTEINFNLSSMSMNIDDIFNTTTNSVKIFINATGIAPYANTIYFDVDRIMLNITYKGFSSQTFNQSVYNAAGGLRTALLNTTLFDSPSNNMTIHIPFNAIIDFYDNYRYQVIWLNETDLAVASFNFTINRIASTITSTSITTGTSLLAGSSYKVQANLIYTENGTAIVNKLLTFHFNLVYRNGTRQDTIKTAFTDSSGNAQAQLDTVDAMQSFTYTVNFTDTNPVFKPASVINNQSVTVLNMLEYIENIILSYAYIIFPAIGAVIVIGVVKRSSDVKKKRHWSADAATIRDVIKIQHLLVIAKSGVCLVNRSYSQMQLDGDLISGFLNAISTFGKEVGGTSTKASEGVVFDYQDFKILLQEGRSSQVAIILNGVPSDNLRLRAKAFIDSFEQTYDLQNWRGNLDYFDGVDNYIEKAFEITLIYPLVINQRKAKKEIKTGLGKALFEVGEAVQKEKQTFYLSTLLNYAQAGRKESQDHVLAEIYWLKREGFFTFYTPQASATSA